MLIEIRTKPIEKAFRCKEGRNRARLLLDLANHGLSFQMLEGQYLRRVFDSTADKYNHSAYDVGEVFET